VDQQLVFDTVARHLLSQRRRAIGGVENNCKYKTPEGLRCAVGCLIPADRYSPAIEGAKASRSVVTERIDPKYGPVLCRDEALLTDLQQVHDGYLVSSWPQELRAVADRFRLQHSVLDEFPACSPASDIMDAQESRARPE